MFKVSLGSFGALPAFDDLVSSFDLNIQYSLTVLLNLYITSILLTAQVTKQNVKAPGPLVFSWGSWKEENSGFHRNVAVAR